MRKSFLAFIFCSVCFSLAAQQKPLQFLQGNFYLSANISKNIFSRDSLKASLYSNRYYVLISFSSLPIPTLQNDLKNVGIELANYIGEKTYLASIENNFNFSLAKNYQITSIDNLPPSFKIDNNIFANTPIDKNDLSYFAISYFSTVQKNEIIEALQNAGAVVVTNKFNQQGLIFIQPNFKVINNIASLPFVFYINKQYTKDKLLNYNSTGAHAVSSLHSSIKNLLGTGVTVGVGDNASITTHIDFNERLINRFSFGPQYHGMHVSGTTVGGGIINPLYTGMAPKSKIISQFFSDVLLNTPSYVSDYKIVATNNSYYSVAVGCAGEGVYDVLSNYIDDHMNNYNEVLHVIAAGNDGQLTCTPYPSFYGTVKSGWQTAKNVITVGNLDIDTYQISSGSSRGPVKDGRIKPEIVANGSNVLSNYLFNTYGLFGGTSMAAPVVTGVTALLQQRYKQLHTNSNAKASLIKTLICNTAEDLGNAGPDYTYGFGMLNARRAVEAIENNQYVESNISQSQTQNLNVTVPTGARRLKVMIHWSDVAAAPNTANALVNDLDVTVTGASGTYLPLTLNSNPANVTDNAIELVDHKNNIEQVVINNPTAGVHTINVTGFAIPSGTQNYFATWQIDMNGVTVEYPYGGEKILPNTNEIIRWNAYGNETNTFTIDYSLDGTAWNLIDNNVAANSRSYTWNVPAGIFSNNAYIRVSRNATTYTDVSNIAFTIAEQPVLTASNPCPGYVSLSWPSVALATSYNILQLDADSMKVIGNTTATNYLVGGLSQYRESWFAIEAVNGSIVSRRSVAKNSLPNSGTCPGIDFQNDLIIDTILTPVTNRIGFAGINSMPTPVKVRIKNNGNSTVSGTFNVSYTPSNLGTTTEPITTTITAGATYDYTFIGAYPYLSSGNINNFKAWVTWASDSHHENDTAYKRVKLLNNDAIILPYVENFETFTDKEFTNDEKGFDGDFIKAGRFDFLTNNSRGRARTFVNTGIAHSGTRAITLDQQSNGSSTTTDSLLLNINATSFPNQSRLEFWYKNHGADNLAGNKVWMRASETQPWLQVFDLYANQNGINQWKLAKININEELAAQMPLANTFQIKFGQEGYTSTNSAVQEQDVDDGYTIDDISIVEAQNDLALDQIINPASGCGLGNTTSISVKIKNYSNASINNIPVSYRINNGATITETITTPIAANTSLNYTFTTPANFSAFIDYTLETWAKYPLDTYAGNDTLQTSFHNSPIINTFPYLEGFENNDGNYYTRTISSTPTSWQWGKPAKAVISKAPNGNNAWVTNLNN